MKGFLRYFTISRLFFARRLAIFSTVVVVAGFTDHPNRWQSMTPMNDFRYISCTRCFCSSSSPGDTSADPLTPLVILIRSDLMYRQPIGRVFSQGTGWFSVLHYIVLLLMLRLYICINTLFLSTRDDVHSSAAQTQLL